METTQKDNRFFIARIAIVVIAVAAIAAVLWKFVPREKPFCFDFLRNMYYGENKTLLHPVNVGIEGGGGLMYFPVETQALQKALEKEGYYIDEYEKTGGQVYLTSFFGPSTATALKSFQAARGLDDTGVVDDETSDALTALYGCKAAPATASSTTP